MQARNLMAWMLAHALEQLQRAPGGQRRLLYQDSDRAPSCWEPAVDLIASGNRVCALLALPGVGRDQLEVSLENACIVVRGERPLGTGLLAGEILRLEIPYGRFECHIALPHGIYQLADMQLENGCLRLQLERLP